MHKTNVIKAIAVMERGDAKYVRADIHEEILEKQSKAAIAGIDAAKLAASKMEREAKRLYAECNPAALESERKANAILTERIAELEQERDAMEKRALAYKAGPDGTCNKYFIRDWGHIRYIARPENNTELEEVSMNKYTLGPAKAVDARIEEVERERDALAASLFEFKGLYSKWNTRQVDDAGFHAGLVAYAEELPGASLVKRDAKKQAQALDLALAAIDRDPVGAREEISGMLLFLRSHAEGGA